MKTVADILNFLEEKGNPDSFPVMAHFGIVVKNRFGVSMPDMRRIARAVGHDHTLALTLWDTGNGDARIVASLIDKPGQLTRNQAEQWVAAFDSWDVCDQVCLNLFSKSPWAWQLIPEWSDRNEEYVKRAAFVLIACLAVHDKQATDDQFIQLFPLLRNASIDERNFVKKAVNWALRSIGKRNRYLNQAGIELAKEIHGVDSKPARWIASDAIRELESDAVQRRLKDREMVSTSTDVATL